jgi:hypothetical protein
VHASANGLGRNYCVPVAIGAHFRHVSSVNTDASHRERAYPAIPAHASVCTRDSERKGGEMGGGRNGHRGSCGRSTARCRGDTRHRHCHETRSCRDARGGVHRASEHIERRRDGGKSGEGGEGWRMLGRVSQWFLSGLVDGSGAELGQSCWKIWLGSLRGGSVGGTRLASGSRRICMRRCARKRQTQERERIVHGGANTPGLLAFNMLQQTYLPLQHLIWNWY